MDIDPTNLALTALYFIGTTVLIVLREELSTLVRKILRFGKKEGNFSTEAVTDLLDEKDKRHQRKDSELRRDLQKTRKDGEAMAARLQDKATLLNGARDSATDRWYQGIGFGVTEAALAITEAQLELLDLCISPTKGPDANAISEIMSRKQQAMFEISRSAAEHTEPSFPHVVRAAQRAGVVIQPGPGTVIHPPKETSE